jgi:DnaJ-class molecular chaperone
MRDIQIGPAMTQRLLPCRDCDGTGEAVDPMDRCRRCDGRRTGKGTSVITACIEPGMRHEERIIFPGWSDELPGYEPGDLVMILDEQPHPYFVRQGDDLMTTKKITLAQALLGVSFAVTHLDGRKLIVNSAPGQVITPDSLKVIPQEGMPVRGSASQKGRLFVKFDIEFPRPRDLTLELKSAFASVLGLPDEVANLDPKKDDLFPVRMEDGDVTELERAESSREKREEAYSRHEEEERDERRDGPTIQCAPM